MAYTPVVHTIMNKLHLADAHTFREAFSHSQNVENCYNDRINPAKYLSRTFQHPVHLLATMFDTGCILSGSRALDFFVPGSATETSDWDFYVPGFKESVADMINILSFCGVQWELEGDTIAGDLLENGKASTTGAVLRRLWSWTQGLEEEERSKLMGGTLNAVLMAFIACPEKMAAGKFSIQKTPGGQIEIIPDESIQSPEDVQDALPSYEEQPGQPFNIMRGAIQTREGRQSIQLIIGCYYNSIKGSLSFLGDFYASHVQCFISGWCASHMYYSHTCSKKAFRWKKSYTRQTLAVEKAIAKYEERGFEFHPTSPDLAFRTLKDSDAFFLDYGDMYCDLVESTESQVVKTWLEERRQHIDSIGWVELDGDICAMIGPKKICSTKQSTFAEDQALPSLRTLRLADLVARSQRKPGFSDSLPASTVGKTLAGVKWDVVEAARSGSVFGELRHATPWSWTL
ncbi:hypothetical protein B0T10DRAFT_513204 [Thelonectria olida]|uniref:Uncharacterized protein n=1 Tax=Thelonectria olida TaxID=1576542 RepID=A0A9P8W5S3_9HYPO|nr:hypothetical protein B0T10DRAFT_513204 [Thelonectria olida]